MSGSRIYFSQLQQDLAISFLIFLSGQYVFVSMFWGTSILAAICVFFIKLTYDWAGPSKILGWILVLGFVLKIWLWVIDNHWAADVGI